MEIFILSQGASIKEYTVFWTKLNIIIIIRGPRGVFDTVNWVLMRWTLGLAGLDRYIKSWSEGDPNPKTQDLRPVGVFKHLLNTQFWLENNIIGLIMYKTTLV